MKELRSLAGRLALAGLLLGASWTARAQDAASVSVPVPATVPAPDPAEAGRKLYVMSCQRCHGIRLATLGIGFDLRTFPQHDKERFLRSVSQGTPRGMPAWSGMLKAGQMDLLWAYIGSVNGWPTASASAAETTRATAPDLAPTQ
jgi:mono/diheme cytochrome c family protein